jgi:flagellar protein FlaG
MQTITPVDSMPEMRPAAAVETRQPAREPLPADSKPEHRVDPADVARLEHALAQHDISLKFSLDETTNRVVVQMIDQKTGEAIRQFPTEVSLSLAANFMKLQGVFLDVER